MVTCNMGQGPGSKPLQHAPLSFWTLLTKHKFKDKIIKNCILRQGLENTKPQEQDPVNSGPTPTKHVSTQTETDKQMS